MTKEELFKLKEDFRGIINVVDHSENTANRAANQCAEIAKTYAEQERIKAKIETLTKFRYRSYESIEEELNNLKKQLENVRT